VLNGLSRRFYRGTPAANCAAGIYNRFMPHQDLSLRLCATVATWRYEQLPPEVITTAKALLLDGLGVIGGAQDAPGIAELNARLGRWEQSGSATGLIGKRRYSPPTAAMANGAAAHALDFDDQHDPARVHTTCVVLPTLLAVAEDLGGVSGRDFLLAFATGAELHARFGLACYNSLGKGWHPTMVFGTLAASVAAGLLLKLNQNGLANALGMAYHQASGSAQSMRDGVLSKRLGAGFAARNAVVAAALAADGLTGTQRTLEGNAGLFALYERGEVNTDALIADLGYTWRVPEYSIKPYPCCRCNHTPIGLGIRLHRQGVRAPDVERIEIRMGEVNWLTVGEPYDVGRDSVVHAQFNAAYSFARALHDGVVDLETYRKPAISEPRIAALARLTTVASDPAIEPNAIEPASVKVTLQNGRMVEASSRTIKGSPQEPMTSEELEAKFRSCLRFGLNATEAQADRLADTISHLEKLDDVGTAIAEAFPFTSQR
jgi:2-methylcitrate dehydratase PrpD